MDTITLETPRLNTGQSIRTVVSMHGTIAAAFKVNEAFQSRSEPSA